MATIDLTNYDTLLVTSSVGRAGVPDGNIYWDNANKRLEIITVEEKATIDMTQHGGGAADPNPLSEDDGIKFEALYAFENQERRVNETLRKFDRFTSGTFKFGGAYELINANKFDDANGSATSLTVDDRFKIRGSGWIERNVAGAIGRIYYGNKSLGDILALSLPYYQLADGGAPVDYDKDGPIDEAVQVYGDIAVDVNTTTFDTRTYEALSVRTFGQNYDRKTLTDSGVSEMGGYSSGFALGESVHLTSGNYTLADVYGVAKISPWTGMTLEKLAVAQNEGGFNEANGNFTWVLHNTIPGGLDQCVAFLDALAQTDDDIDSGAVTVTNGKRVGTWYYYDAQGRIVTQSGADALGLFIEAIPTADEQNVVFTADDTTLKTRPFQVELSIEVGQTAVDDILAWYHAYFLDGPAGNDYNTALAVTVQDSVPLDIKGNVSTDVTGTKIIRAFDYDGDALGGTAGTDKDVVFLVEGDGGAVQVKTVFSITRITTVSATAAPGQENNV